VINSGSTEIACIIIHLRIFVGMYMPVLGLIGFPLLFKALTIWLRVIQETKVDEGVPELPLRASKIGSVWFSTHICGIILVHGSAAISRYVFTPVSISNPKLYIFYTSTYLPTLHSKHNHYILTVITTRYRTHLSYFHSYNLYVLCLTHSFYI